MSRQISRQPTDEQLAAIASTAESLGEAFKVLSSDGKTDYIVTARTCTCPSWVHDKSFTGEKCKHQLAIELICPPQKAKPYKGDPFEGFA